METALAMTGSLTQLIALGSEFSFLTIYKLINRVIIHTIYIQFSIGLWGLCTLYYCCLNCELQLYATKCVNLAFSQMHTVVERWLKGDLKLQSSVYRS